MKSSPNNVKVTKLRRMRVEKKTRQKCLSEKVEGKRPIPNYRQRRGYNININIETTVCEIMD
jgi:hypothetical protein